MISMSRNSAAGSNTKPAAIGFGSTPSYQFYEQVYTTQGPQEWIVLPDCNASKVTISFPGGGQGYIQGTSSPPDMLGATGQEVGVSPVATAYSPVVYTLLDTVTDATSILVQGDTAIRVNSGGGTVCISVRC